MIVRGGPWIFLPQAAVPTGMVSNERAELNCGCKVWIGLRLDNHEVATDFEACSDDHQPLAERFNLALTDSLVNPSRRPLVDVVDELLVSSVTDEGRNP
jgi:hypothetical protein